MDQTGWIQMISSVGFPIVVASYLLLRMERVITELRDAIRSLVTEVRVIKKER